MFPCWRWIITAAALATLAVPLAVYAQSDTVKIGVILPMTGPSASTGKQIDAAIKLWIAQNGDKAGGKKVEVIVKDDAGVADTTRRLAQEMVVNDKVAALAGFGLTPLESLAAGLLRGLRAIASRIGAILVGTEKPGSQSS